MVDTRLAHRDIVRLIDQHRIAGVVTANSSIALLDKAMKAVLDGDLWFGRDMVHALISARSGVKEGDIPFENGESLSPREKDVISLICNGYTNKEVAVHLALSEQTIRTHLSRIFKKTPGYQSLPACCDVHTKRIALSSDCAASYESRALQL